MVNKKEESDSVNLRNRERTSVSSSTSSKFQENLINGINSNSKSVSSSVKSKTEKDEMKRTSFYLKKLLYLTIFLGGCFYSVTWLFGTSNNSHSVTWWDEKMIYLGFQEPAYVVVIDAGSTGTRVLSFAFYQSGDKSLKLKDELFLEVKPGLSSFADNPEEGAKTLQKLLSRAKTFVPEDKWNTTPLSLKATAGLRLLPKEKSDAILLEVSKTLQKSGFYITDESVGIMDGTDEGIFSWFTVNFLLDRIGEPVAKTVAALDLGGGSTQITVASTPSTAVNYPAEDLQNISLFHQSVPLYTKSYLGLGLQSVRKAVLSHNKSENSDPKLLVSLCVNPIVSREWVHGGITYTIKGAETGKFENVKYNGVFSRKEPIADWDECYKIIVKLIEEKGVIKSKDLNRQIVVFSYFFERATEAGLIDPFEGGKITVQHYFDAGKTACKTVNTDLPLLCLDLTFMGALLHNGYGLNKHTPILALKKIKGHEISWALGLGYHTLQNRI